MNAGTIQAVLELNAQPFTSGISSAMQQLQTFANGSNTAGDRITALGGAMTAVGSTLTKTVTTPLLGIGAGAIKVAADFESGMSKVQAISGASASDMELLSSKAKELGANTKFSASEASDAFSYMAKIKNMVS